MEISESTMVGCCLRNRLVDDWITGVVGHTDTVVVDIGVGLDTRMLRRPLAVGQHVEVDYRAVIGLRNELLPCTGAVRVAGDGMRVDEWAGVIDRRKTPRAVIILEGVLAYQEPARVSRFFTDVAAILPGAFLVFDSLSPWARWLGNRSDSLAGGRPRYEWATWRTKTITSGSRRLRIVHEKGFMDLSPELTRGFCLRQRVTYALPPMRRSYRLTLSRLPEL